MKDLTKLPMIEFSEEIQREIARRGMIVDDNKRPPVESKGMKKRSKSMTKDN